VKEITLKRKINCGKQLCRNCSGVDWDGRGKFSFYCHIFGKGLPETNKKSVESEPLRLLECIEAENG